MSAPETQLSLPASRLIRRLSFLLRRRYFIRTYGDPVPADAEPRLILANHPSLIAPLIVYSIFAHLAPRPLMDEEVFKRFGRFAKYFDPIIVPDLSRGGDPAQLEQAIENAVNTLLEGRSVLMWPTGRLQRDGRDVPTRKSGAWRIVRAVKAKRANGPEMLLVRTEGLWGSRFSLHLDREQSGLVRKLMKLLPAFLLFGPVLPRRQVRLMLRRHMPSPADCASMERFNAIISAWFMAGNHNIALVPVVPFIRPLPLPQAEKAERPPPDVDIASALELLAPYGASPFTNGKTRLEELGMDSLAVVRLILTIESLYGYAPAPVELQTVADVALALLHGSDPEPPALERVEPAPLRLPPLAPVQELFSRRGDIRDITLNTHFPRGTLMAYAEAVSLLTRDLPGRNLGIALPAGAAGMAAFAGCLGAGKIPVMLNYTMETERLTHCAELAQISHILTSRRMYGRGIPPGVRTVFIEDVDTSRLRRKALASFFGFDWAGDPDAPAVILFTSGSTSLPKGVPLTHRNLIHSLRALLSVCTADPLSIKRMSLLCCLPPFHSPGFLTNILLPLVCGVPAVCVADPGNAPALAKAAVACGTTHFIGTPGILHGMLAATQAPLPFKQVILSAEHCPKATRNLFALRCPEGALIESYGTTECSGIISLNHVQTPHSVGYALPGLDYKIHEGRLYVRGESVFSAYLDDRTPKMRLPSSLHDDWFPTGDLFAEEHGALFFQGRADRVVTRGNEILSLGAMEETLREQLADSAEDRAFQLALVSAPDGRIIAFCREGIKLATLNAALHAAGFDPVWKVDEAHGATLPEAAAGKVDYRALAALAAEKSG